MQKAAVICLILFALTGLATAQVPSANIFFGYSYAHVDLTSNSGGSLNGWNGSLEGKFLPWVGLVADFGGYYGTHSVPQFGNVDSHVYTVLFGPQVSVPVGRFTPFAHGLIGVGHVNANAVSDSQTSISTALGGGLDYKIIKGLAWRGQLDYLQTRFYSRTQNNARFSTGIVIRF